MSSKATKGLSWPTFSPWGFLQPCQELWAFLNSRTFCKTQKMNSEPPRPLTSYFGEFKGLTCFCHLRPCWTRAGETVCCSLPGSWRGASGQVAQGRASASGWRPCSGSCFELSVLPEAPGAAALTELCRGL